MLFMPDIAKLKYLNGLSDYPPPNHQSCTFMVRGDMQDAS